MSPIKNHLVKTMRSIDHVHFVGIGGSGMGGIAEVLLRQGYAISGSDIQSNETVERLRSLGANIFITHDQQNIEGVDVVVVSSAIQSDNPEILAAKAQRIPVVPRAEMLGELMRFRNGIAIAGSHGKTTTTSLVASVLAKASLDPTYVIGGLLNSVGCHAHLGSGDYLVAEADESDASFLYLKPMISVITNIDRDHMQTYDNNFENLKDTFIQFTHNLPFYGLVIACIDGTSVRDIVPRLSRPLITYGFSDDADVRLTKFTQVGIQSTFSLTDSHGVTDKVTLNLPGKHNALNAAASIIIAQELGVSRQVYLDALQAFEGVGRRFQVHGDFVLHNRSITLVDDYGHHPKEVHATIEAVKQAWPDRRVVMVFQPHRYSRTEALFDEFVDVLPEADELLLIDIYPASETPRPNIDSENLWQAINDKHTVSGAYVGVSNNLHGVLQSVLKDGDILLMQGAGDIGRLASDIAKEQVHIER